MKRYLLYAVMGAFLAVPLAFWARTFTAGARGVVYLYDAGRLLALLGSVLIFFQYVLSSRIKIIERGIGLDGLIAVHRVLGVVGATFVLVHPLLLLSFDILVGLGLVLQPLKVLGAFNLSVLWLGAGAALLYRRLHLRYEAWHLVHRVNYAVLPLSIVHGLLLGSHLSSGPLRAFWWALGGLYVSVLAAKIWNSVRVRRFPYGIVQVARETDDTWTLRFQGRRLDHRPGQFLFLRLIRNNRLSESHPFTISSSPARDKLAVTIKSVGDFTSSIGQTRTSDGAYIDGPYGVFSFVNHDAPDLVFIAGGIGITPFLSMLRYMHHGDVKRSVTLIWGNKSERDIVSRGELEQMAEEVSWLKIVHVMSRQPDWAGEKGHIDAEILKRHVRDFSVPQFFVCGPPRMMTTVVEALRSLGVPRHRIHYERFALR